ncbi:protein DpdD [Actinosynnema pretiosum]|nr:protein DpdD [Actinosynnema pretiosum]
MTEATTTLAETEFGNRAAEFLSHFFGEGNDAGEYKEVVDLAEEHITSRANAPVVLPRFNRNEDLSCVYVVASDSAYAAHVPDLITAFAGPTYCKTANIFPARLDPADPIEAAVIHYFGATTPVYRLEAGNNTKHRQNLRTALMLMQKTVARRPVRQWRAPKPLGRLLSEFDAALASGGEAASAVVLDQLSTQGGLSASNLTYLKIKRLDRLGRSAELLRMGDLPDVLHLDPPKPIQDAVLNAVFDTALAEAVAGEDVELACARLSNCEPPLPLPLRGDVVGRSASAVAVMLLAAIGRRDFVELDRMLSARDTQLVPAVPVFLWDRAEELLARSSTDDRQPPAGKSEAAQSGTDPVEADQPALQLPTSWPELVADIAEHRDTIDQVLEGETWREWSPLDTCEEEVARILSTFDDHAWESTGRLVGMVIEAVGYAAEAPRTSRELLIASIALDRLGGGDLLALHSLFEIFLRSSPAESEYRDLLEALRDSSKQWVSVVNAAVVLDFVDRLVLAAAPDESARTNIALALLGPLHRRQARLKPSDFAFARQLCSELDIRLEWADADEQDKGISLTDVPASNVLLYSLDEAVLRRVAEQFAKSAPQLKVVVSHDAVGNDSLRQKARNADVVVLATRCAKHAATGFITANANKARISYADGSGSASLFRAAVEGVLRE